MVEEAHIPNYSVDVVDSDIIAGANETVNFTLLVNNMGREKDTYIVEVIDIEVESEDHSSGHVGIWTDDTVAVQKRNEVEFLVQVVMPVNAGPGDRMNFTVRFTSRTNEDHTSIVELSAVAGELSLRYNKKTSNVHPENRTSFKLEVKNIGDETMTVVLNVSVKESVGDVVGNWFEPTLNSSILILGPFQSGTVILEVGAADSASVDDYIIMEVTALNKDDPSIYDKAIFEVTVD